MLFSKLDAKEQQNIIDFIKEHFKYIYSEDCYLRYDKYDDEITEAYFEELSDKVGANYYANGATKIAFFFNEFKDWVIKVPILGSYNEDLECSRTYQFANKHTDLADESDYCAAEVYLYSEAQYYGVADLFASTEYLTSVNDIKVYISEKIPYELYDGMVPSIDYNSDSYKKASNVLSYLSENTRFYPDTLAYFIEQYPEEIMQCFYQFVVDYDISDLHSANLGFDKDCKVKILDCSGFYD